MNSTHSWMPLAPSRASAGMLVGLPLVLALAYVLSWPPVVLRTTKYRFGPMTLGGPDGQVHTMIPVRPAWHDIYRPLSNLNRMEKGRGPLTLYWNWWYDALDHTPEFIR
jgi:hypothetical protein